MDSDHYRSRALAEFSQFSSKALDLASLHHNTSQSEVSLRFILRHGSDGDVLGFHLLPYLPGMLSHSVSVEKEYPQWYVHFQGALTLIWIDVLGSIQGVPSNSFSSKYILPPTIVLCNRRYCFRNAYRPLRKPYSGVLQRCRDQSSIGRHHHSIANANIVEASDAHI